MSILMDQNTNVIVQGITGAQPAYHARLMNEYNVKPIVGGSVRVEGESGIWNSGL